MESIPKWAIYVAGGLLAIVAIYFVAEYLGAATSMLPGVEQTGG